MALLKDADALLGKVHMSGTPCKSPPQAGMCQDLLSLLQQHDTFHRAFEGLVIVGTAVGAATVVYALWPRAKQERSTSVRVVPVVEPSVGGAFVSGTF